MPSALKMLWIGPISLIMLARARWQERGLRRAERRYEQHLGERSMVAV